MKKVPAGKSVTAINYTDEMVAKLREAAPMDYAKAKALAPIIGRSAKSIVSKCKSEGIEYISQPAPVKKVAPRTKAQTLALIEREVGIELTGLDKAPAAALVKVLTLFRSTAEIITALENQLAPVDSVTSDS